MPSKIIIGIMRTVVMDAPDLGPLDTRSYQLSMVTDSLEIEIPDGHFVSNLWMMADGIEVVSIPLDPAGIGRWFDYCQQAKTYDSITCPQCGAQSFNGNDILEGYCGKCHDWTRDSVHVTSRPGARRLGRVTMVKAVTASFIVPGAVSFYLGTVFSPGLWVYAVIGVVSGVLVGDYYWPYARFTLGGLLLTRRKAKRRNAGQLHEPQ